MRLIVWLLFILLLYHFVRRYLRQSPERDRRPRPVRPAPRPYDDRRPGIDYSRIRDADYRDVE